MADKAIAVKYSDEKGSPVLAIILGVFVDLGGTLVFGFVIAIGYGILLAVQGLSPDQISIGISQMDENPVLMIVLYASGCSLSALGGYVCARIVNFLEYKYAMVAAFISSVYGCAIGWRSHAVGTNIGLFLLTIGCVMLGAHIYVRMKHKRQAYAADRHPAGGTAATRRQSRVR